MGGIWGGQAQEHSCEGAWGAGLAGEVGLWCNHDKRSLGPLLGGPSSGPEAV